MDANYINVPTTEEIQKEKAEIQRTLMKTGLPNDIIRKIYHMTQVLPAANRPINKQRIRKLVERLKMRAERETKLRTELRKK